MTFAAVPTATFGWANETESAGACPNSSCFVQNGIVAGVVKDPLDPTGAHFHGSTLGTSPAAQYHPDATGMYFRLSDLTDFSLQSIQLDAHNGTAGGNFVMYGFDNAINPGILTSNGSSVVGAFGDSKFAPTDPEGGVVPHVAKYTIANNGFNSTTVTLAQLLAQDSHWNNIGAFWITFEGFNHSPTTSYASSSTVTDPDTGEVLPVYPYPSWDLRVDNVKLGAAVAAPVPVPSAVWLFGTGLIGLVARRRKA